MNASQHTISTKEIGNSPAITRALTTLDLIMEMRNPGNARISTDGKRMAFVVREPMPGEQKNRRRIWLAEIDGSQNPRPISTGKHDEISPCWSPDGKSLAFVTCPEGEKEKPQLTSMLQYHSDYCRPPRRKQGHP